MDGSKFLGWVPKIPPSVLGGFHLAGMSTRKPVGFLPALSSSGLNSLHHGSLVLPTHFTKTKTKEAQKRTLPCHVARPSQSFSKVKKKASPLSYSALHQYVQSSMGSCTKTPLLLAQRKPSHHSPIQSDFPSFWNLNLNSLDVLLG